MLLGSKFSLLRAQFYEKRKIIKTKNQKFNLKKFLISFGSTDSKNISLKALLSVLNCNFNFSIDIVLGYYDINNQELINTLKKIDKMNLNN